MRVPNTKISGLVQEVLINQDWCVAIINNKIHTIPISLVSVIETITVKDVGDYEAIVHKDRIQVGCQTITKEKFQEIVNAFNKLG